MASAKITTDHQEIRQWVESRGGYPAEVESTAKRGTGLLRIDYPGFSGKGSLRRISWEEFFRKFDESKLAFLYQDEGDSRFSKLVKRDGAGRKTSPAAKRRPTRARKSASKRTRHRAPAKAKSARAKKKSGRATAKQQRSARR